MTQRSLETSKVMVESGIIPVNTLHQLVHWRLLPESSAQSHGNRKVTLDSSKPEEVSQFVEDLGRAISKDMAEIRETELNRSGGFRKIVCWHSWESAKFAVAKHQVFVDRLGRLVVPVDSYWKNVIEVMFDGESIKRKVVKTEERYEDEKVVAFVLYLEAKKELCDAPVN